MALREDHVGTHLVRHHTAAAGRRGWIGKGGLHRHGGYLPPRDHQADRRPLRIGPRVPLRLRLRFHMYQSTPHSRMVTKCGGHQAVLGNVVVARAHTSEHQADLLISLTALMAEEACFRLLVVDSITAPFRTDYTGRGELAERQQKLNAVMAKLKKISEEFNVAVVVTNQVVSDPGGGAMFVSDPKKPVGGHVMAHASTTRLSLRKGKGEQRLIKVVASPYLAEAEASFQCSGQGITDHKD
ncbi:hypothetical protein Vafri_17137 [Volvox africanus]|uniref:Uncharacterized protein n=1 Tax=Volvox africanus TaxID=51714 RepID=A0A8J4BIR2_9CHLO|nr:hypothetical protein Vafri_17137 [Volvox africanus]